MFRDTGAWIMDKRASFIELPPLCCHFGASAQLFHNGVILRRCFDEIEEWLPHFSRFRPGDACMTIEILSVLSGSKIACSPQCGLKSAS